jgi:hypothetical protein
MDSLSFSLTFFVPSKYELGVERLCPTVYRR